LIDIFLDNLYNLNLYHLMQIIMIDLILAGDNAIVIAMAASKIHSSMRNKVIILGTFGAIIIRLSLTSIAILLLSIKGLMLIGGALLFYITYKLLMKKENKSIDSKNSFLDAVITIIVADVVMSIDNVMAVAGVAHGDFLLVVIGICISIFLVIFGSKLLINILDRYPVINYVGAFLISYTGASMMFEDFLIKNFINFNDFYNHLDKILAVIISVIFIGILKLIKKK
jgi:YjbE family integral membrane protein